MQEKNRKAIDAKIKALLQSRKNIINYGNVPTSANSIKITNSRLVKKQPASITKPPQSTCKKLVPKKIAKFTDGNASYKHSGDIGDLIYSLPVIKFLGEGVLYLNTAGLPSRKPDGTYSGFTDKTFGMLKPLLESQKYITEVRILDNNKPVVDLDYFRSGDCSILNLCEKILYSYSIPFNITDDSWIKCNPKKIASHVFARSFRYRNENINYSEIMKRCGEDCVFIGLPEEHQDFENKFGKISYYEVKDFLDMAEVIAGSDCFYGNQSSPMSLAIAMNVQLYQECFLPHSDCVFQRSNATYLR
jgi:hypothetical protein